MRFLAKGFSAVALVMLTGGLPVWGEQSGTETPAPKAPVITPAPAAAPDTPTTGKPAAAKVNINTADEVGLMAVDGIGSRRAKAILEYRQTNGAFKTIEDLKKVKGIKEKSFSRIKDQVTVE